MENGGLQVEGQDKVGRVALLPFRENGLSLLPEL